MTSDSAFLSRYKQLNREQKEAVDTIEGPVMVVAGPGTGKTRILTLRIAQILHKTDTPPDSILALTFTESGVYSMRKNLIEIIGSTAYRVHISTFHGFCNDVIKENPEEFPDIIGGIHISSVEQIQILQEIIEEGSFLSIKPGGDPFYYVYPILKKIGELKKDAVDPKELLTLLQNEEKEIKKAPDFKHKKGAFKGRVRGAYAKRLKELQKLKEFHDVYKKYEQRLTKERLYDYDDMIVKVIDALSKNKDLSLRLQEQFQYILADEHQDANRGQNKILELLTSFHSPRPNLFIVGDEKQAIFRFQGASLENFLYFQNLYPHAKRVDLAHNYRSTQPILDAAHSVIEKSKSPVTRKKLLGEKEKKTSPHMHLRAFTRADTEIFFVAQEIERLVEKEHVPPSEIAVLYRDNKDVFPFVEALEKTKVPFTIFSNENIFNDIDIRKCILLLQAVESFGKDEYLVPLLHLDFLAISDLDVFTLSSYAKDNRMRLYDVLRSDVHMKKMPLEDREGLSDVYKKLLAWKKMSSNMELPLFFERLMRESGFFEYLLAKKEGKEKIDKLGALYDELRNAEERHPHYTLGQFVAHLDVLNTYSLFRGARTGPELIDSVKLMTAHGSKGLEFSHVFIVGTHDRHWGNRKSRELLPVHLFSRGESDIEDERRLFYVALTRAKKYVSISYSREDSEGRQRLPSQFIEEIDKAFIEEKDVGEVEKHFLSKKPKNLFTARTRVGEEMQSYVQRRFLEQGLSVTALNNYLVCPWKYFYINLVRIPQAKTKSQVYGTAIHEALKWYFDGVSEKGVHDKKTLTSFFEKALVARPLPIDMSKQYLKRGKDALSGYYDTYHMLWNTRTKNEFAIRGVLFSEGVTLNGMLDKIEFIDDKEVVVTDYKTGTIHSRNYIEGKTKNATGDYKRQLVFYKLLLSLFDEGTYAMKEGVIDFVEPDGKGRYKKEVFVISDKEVDELRKMIVGVSNDITSLSFWSDACGDSRCVYCAMRRTLFSKK